MRPHNGKDRTLPDSTFTTMWALYFGLKIPILRHFANKLSWKVTRGKKREKKTINLQSTGHHTVWHDALKYMLYDMMVDAGLAPELEPKNIFISRFRNQKEVLSLSKREQQNQGCVPDIVTWQRNGTPQTMIKN